MGIINGTAVKHASIGIIADTMSAVKKRTTRNSPNIREERNSEELDTSQEDSYTGDEDQKRNESPESLKTRKLSKSPTASPKESTRKRKPSKSIQEKGATPSTGSSRVDAAQDTEDSTQDTEDNRQDTEDSTHEKLFLSFVHVRGIILAIIAILLYMYMYYMNPQMLQFGTYQNAENSNSSDPLLQIKEDFKKYLSELQRTFTTQDKDFWKKIKVPVLRVIKEEEPEYPAVLLLVVPKGESTSQTATCLAKKYRSNLSKLYRGSGNINEAYIDAQTLSSSGSVENIKYDLDNKIKELLDNTNTELPTMVIDHIEALDPNVMLLFHGYCDGDYAPHKKALILFVLHTNLDSKEIKNLDRTVDGLLQSLWGKNLDADKIPPLIARIANNKAMIHEEKMSSLTNSGC
eukprot:XP_019923356.1 PREDICTED: uncharacterized protein LOC105329643 [Crassostrea gigas]